MQWGEACVEHLIGDWSFVVWQPTNRRLFLARDQLGMTALYYYTGRDYTAFATRRKLLLALDPGLAQINDLYLAQFLLNWRVLKGDQTPHLPIHRLPPAHTAVITDGGTAEVRYYWQVLHNVTPLSLRTVEEAAEGALVHFDEAVRCRVDSHRPMAVSLSGGLDSGAVALTAAQMLRGTGQSLAAYTGLPLDDDEWTAVNKRFGSEWALALVISQHAMNIRHYPVRAESFTPLAGLRYSLWVHDGPVSATSNAFWMYALMKTASDDGAQIILNGQTGNAGLSWPGVRPKKDAASLRNRLKDVVPLQLRRVIWRRRLLRSIDYGGITPLHPDLARRSHVADVGWDDPAHPYYSLIDGSLLERVVKLGAGRTIVGALYAEWGAALGFEPRDPTADIRLLRYCLGVPPHLFVDLETGMRRMLMRTAMAGRMPDAVRLNPRFGLQAADLITRLRADRAAMEACLDELERGDGRYYVNLPVMRNVWQAVQEREDRETLRNAASILLRGIAVGFFVQQPTIGPRPDEI